MPAAKKPATAPKATATKTTAVKAKAAPSKPKSVKPRPMPKDETLRDQAAGVANKATAKAREYAESGKDKVTGVLGDVSQTVEEMAKSIDERLGTVYGDYARKAASAVSGVADSIKSKDVDGLVDETRNFVRKQPAIALGAAAAVGFVLMRLLKSGSGDKDDA